MAIGFLEDVQLWSFDGQAAARLIGATSDWDEWFDEETIMVVSPILDTNERYVDKGGSMYGPLDVTFAFETPAARSEFAARRGSDGILGRPGGVARMATLRKVKPIASGTPNYYLLNCTFEAL